MSSTSSKPDVYATFADFVTALSRHGEKAALIDAPSQATISYLALQRRIYGRAHQLKSQGLPPGERIALYRLGSLEWVEWYFAALLNGLVVVPFDQRISDDLVRDMLATTKPRIVVTTADHATTALRLSDHVQLSADVTPAKSFATDHALDNSALAEIILTSGTWAQPKGVALTHANLLSNLAATRAEYQLTTDECFLSLLPLSHAYEQMCGLLMPLAAGCTVVYAGEINPASLKDTLRRYNITLIVAVPRILELFYKGITRQIPPRIRPTFVSLARACSPLPLPLKRRLFKTIHARLAPSLRRLVVGGAPLDPALDIFFQGIGYHVLVGYGLSETSPIVSLRVDTHGTPGTVGTILPSLTARIDDEQQLLLKGPSVFWGYWPDAREPGWFNTGDQAIITKSGELRITGRTKSLVVYPNGDKLALDDLERLVESFPGIMECAAVYDAQSARTELPLVVRLAPDTQIDSGALRDFIAMRVPAAAKIGNIHVTSQELPRTHTLKLARQKVLDQYGPTAIENS